MWSSRRRCKVSRRLSSSADRPPDGVRRALTDAGDVIVRAIPTDNLSARMVLQPVSKRLCASILTPDRVLWGYAFLPTVDQANSCLNHGSCGFFESWFPKI